MALSARIGASVVFTLTGAPDQGSAKAEVEHAIARTIANGTGNSQADIAWHDEFTIASNTSVDVDLAPVTDALGAAKTPVEITTLLIESDAANTTDLTIGGATAEFQAFFAAAGDKAVIKPGGFLLVHNPVGWAIAAGTTDDLAIANSTGAIATVRLTYLGRSA